MAYTTIDDPTIYFNTVLYSGTGSNQSVTGTGFTADWIWLKERNGTDYHFVNDSVRGKGSNNHYLNLHPNATSTESDQTTGVNAINSNGFDITYRGELNESGKNYVAWNWKAGTSFSNDASATSVGTIDSSGSTNQTAGFSIVSWTGTGSAGTIAHNLGSIPEWYIIKVRSGATNNWAVYHNKSNANPEQYALYLDGTSAATDDSGLANDTAPTSTVFSVTSGNYANQNGYTYIGYFFSEIKGYSKFGSYTGNGNADGTFVYTGFKPAWVMFKHTSSADNWEIYDNKRLGHNVDNEHLFPNLNNAEASADRLDILSNGFKSRIDSTGINGNGSNYIYMAFAESPFTNSNGIPNNAR